MGRDEELSALWFGFDGIRMNSWFKHLYFLVLISHEERKMQVESGIFYCPRKQKWAQKTNGDIQNEYRSWLEEVTKLEKDWTSKKQLW